MIQSLTLANEYIFIINCEGQATAIKGIYKVKSERDEV